MNTTFVRLELRRIARDRLSLFFIAVLPAFFYLIFGAAQDYSTAPVGEGNVAMLIMISMAAYGAVTATTGIGGMAAVERMQGWGRQLGITPLGDGSFVTVKAVVAVAVATIPLTLIFVLGAATGARAPAHVWVLAAVALLVGAFLFSLVGLVAGLAFRTEGAVGAVGGVLVVLGFLGNVFVPLTGTLLAIAKFTPLYGYVALARYPLTEGVVIDGSGGVADVEPLWVPLLNLGAWTLVLALAATLLVRRGRGRQ